MAPRTQRLEKRVLGSRSAAGSHWVGDGFPVRTLFSYADFGRELSPFLLLDYAGPRTFPPTTGRLGVGEHPHRGFETVTIVYEGEVEHRDSSGGGGRIGKGDVQWMTAAAGLVHEEFHGREFARLGGTFRMAQLWVNLPARDKRAPPRYQSIESRDIPVVRLPDGKGKLRVIAGEWEGARGPARTFTPMHVWDLSLQAGGLAVLAVPEGWPAAVAVLEGALRVHDTDVAEGAFAWLDRAGEGLRLQSPHGGSALVLAGEPIDEPIVGHGPFVMNTTDEIHQAILDYQSGRMGHLA